METVLCPSGKHCVFHRFEGLGRISFPPVCGLNSQPFARDTVCKCLNLFGSHISCNIFNEVNLMLPISKIVSSSGLLLGRG
jgi:hypothetical protein